MKNANEFGSDDAVMSGSSNSNTANDPSQGGEGQSDNNAKAGDQSQGKQQDESKVDEEMYKELEKKLGEQGKELGDYRSFFEEVSPLLEKLDADPDLTKAILDGKISSETLKPVLEGKASIDDAKAVTKAHEDVKKEMGKEGYDKATPEEVEARVAEKLGKEFDTKLDKFKAEVTQNLNDSEKLKEFEDRISSFIDATPDFPQYAEAIDKWCDEHPHIVDIQVAYEAVKGQALADRYKKEEEERSAEAAKDVAANASGGSSKSTGQFNKEELLDKLIRGTGNPNVF